MSAGMPYVEVDNGRARRDSCGTIRPVTTGTFIARGVNPLGNPCPSCDAKRYERCYEWKGIGADRFLDVLPVAHSRRVALYSAGAPVKEEEHEEAQ